MHKNRNEKLCMFLFKKVLTRVTNGDTIRPDEKHEFLTTGQSHKSDAMVRVMEQAANGQQKTKRVTRNDVARRANVSPAVVSYVLNDSKFVSPEKVAAVRKAIEELQYRPNLQARGLKTNQSMQIAFVCDNLMNYWLEGAEQLLFENGYYVSHCYSRGGDEFIDMLIARQFDAVFMMSNRYSTSQLNRLAGIGIPVVLYKTRTYGKLDPRIVTVAPDYKDGVVQSVNFLVMKGHKNIALIPPSRYKISGHLDDGYRLAAYASALRQNGIEPRTDLICAETDNTEDTLNRVCSMLLRTDPSSRPTAFIAGNDFLAVNILRKARQLGLRSPEDVAVIGADNTYIADTFYPGVTSVDFSKETFCRQLAEALLGLIQGQRPEDQILPVSLFVREST